MTMTAAEETIVLRCELGAAEVRELMAASRLLTLMRRSWLAAGIFFAALLAESIVLLRFVAARPAAYGTHRSLLLDELIAGVGLCLLLVCWSVSFRRLAPEQRVAEQQEAAVAHARKQEAGDRPHLSPGHLRVHDGRAGTALAADGPVGEAERDPGHVGQVVAERPVSS
jgi:hypothetical protein